HSYLPRAAQAQGGDAKRLRGGGNREGSRAAGLGEGGIVLMDQGETCVGLEAGAPGVKGIACLAEELGRGGPVIRAQGVAQRACGDSAADGHIMQAIAGAKLHTERANLAASISAKRIAVGISRGGA